MKWVYVHFKQFLWVTGVSRRRKLLIVATVLAVGIALAWPFRLAHDEQSTQRVDTLTQSVPVVQQPNFQNEPVSEPVAAKMTSTAPPIASFDLANHPAMTKQEPKLSPPMLEEIPVTPTPSHQFNLNRPTLSQEERDSRPVYQTIETPTEDASAWPREVIHTVQDGDTLEILAKRYLGNESRAIEIYDMNRDKLTNPHQLPIDVELRVPVAPGRLLD